MVQFRVSQFWKEAIKYSRNCAELHKIARNWAEVHGIACNGIDFQKAFPIILNWTYKFMQQIQEWKWMEDNITVY